MDVVANADKAPTQKPAQGLNSAVLARLMEEVRNGAMSAVSAYNRMHNRHNR